MNLNNCCLDCAHRKIPDEIKRKFNEKVYRLFYECPLKDKRITGCTIKYISIDWDSFLAHLEKVSDGR